MLASLLDRADGEPLPLPPELAARYGGELRFPQRTPHVFANFVSTIDGVVSFKTPGEDRARHVSRGEPADRFVLALLRAAADAVIVGAGTLRKEPDSVWTAESAFPDAGDAFARLRSAAGRPAQPLTVLVSASGELDLTLPAFVRGGPVLIATTSAGAKWFRRTPSRVAVRALSDTGELRMRDVVKVAMEVAGGGRILTEGGATILGRFLDERALDELFLTVAPRIAGRTREIPRVGLVEGAAFAANAAPGGRLVSLKSAGDYLFTRYAFAKG
jgi:riboflavin biosynthesis pyrimidine reductase